jgi:energy-coupling factor transporter ATP-binding protein EcfA2
MSQPDGRSDSTAQVPIVDIRHLSKGYRRGGHSVPVLSDISLQIAAGDFVGLMGPSGSGKSTLLNLIAGIDKPDGGTLRVSGIDIAGMSEANIAKVKIGQPCEIQLDALPGLRFRGEVQRTVPTVDRSKATVTVKIRFIDSDERVLPEMSAKVAFLSREVPKENNVAAVAVPAAAVVERDGRKVVYVVRDGKAAEVQVEARAGAGDFVQVSGVRTGDKVVLKPADRVRDGVQVVAAGK